MIKALLLGTVLLGCSSCITFNAIRHDPDLAAERAIQFAKEAFIDLNQPGAYEFLSEDLKQEVSLDKFIGVVAQMHPDNFPRVIRATDYAPVMGQKVVVIWLTGENATETFYYELTMAGTVRTNYKVASVYRVDKIPHSQGSQSLSKRLSTSDLR